MGEEREGEEQGNGWRSAETGIDRRQNTSVAYHSLSLGLVRDPNTCRHCHYTSDGGVLTDEEEVEEEGADLTTGMGG